MQTSVAPIFQASTAFCATCSRVRKYVSASRGPRLKAQNLHPTKQTLVKLIFRFTTYVTRLPTNSRRSVSAATNRPSKSSPSASARSKHCSRDSTPPSCACNTCSSAAREAGLILPQMSAHSREEKFSSSDDAKARFTNPPQKVLVKQIVGCRANQFACAPPDPVVPEAPDDAGWRTS